MRRLLVVLSMVFALAAAAFAQDPKPGAKEEWEKALAAFRAKDDGALAALATKTREDPWLVADSLCAAKEFDAAGAFAKLVTRKGSEKLAAYVTSRRTAPSDDAIRKAFAAADAALRAKDGERAVTACETVSRKGADVPSLRLAFAYAFALRELRRFEDAAVVCDTATKTAEELGWTRQAFRFATSEAQAYERTGNAMLATLTYSQTVELAQELGDKELLASALMDSTVANLNFEILESALELGKRALALHQELGDRANAAGDSVNIGLAYVKQGNLSEALPCFQRGLDDALAAGHKRYASNAMGNIGLVMFLRKDFDKAADWYEKARKMKEEIGDERGVAGEYTNLARLRQVQGKLDDAKAGYEKALAMQERLGWRGDTVRSHRGLASIAAAQKRHADAAKHLEAVLAVLAPNKLMNDLVPLHAELGLAYEAAGDKARAEENLREAWPFLDVLVAPDVRAKVHAAVKRLGVDLESAPRGGGSGGGGTSGHAATARKKWKEAQDALAKDDKGGAMGALRDAASELAAYTDEDLDPVRDELDAVFRTGVQLGVDVNDAATVYYFLALRRARWLVERIDTANEGWTTQAGLTSAGRARTKLSAGKAYVVYGAFADETFAVVLTFGAQTLVKLGPTQAIADVCAKIDLSDVARNPEPALAELRRLVVAPLALPADVTRVLVCAPDRLLSNLPPWALFPDLEAGAILSPEAALAMTVPQAPGSERLALGDDTDAKAFGATRLDPKTTTWSALVSRLAAQPAWYVVALAAKTVLDPDEKDALALSFAPEDGVSVVDGAHIVEASLPVRALWLTGGPAAHSSFTAGDGMWNLADAFLAAGAHGVIASIWEPDPAATRALAQKFVENWGAKTSKSAAFRRAQEFVRSQPQWKHPRFWAGWVLTGLLD